MKVTVLLLGPAKQWNPEGSCCFELPKSSRVQDIKQKLVERFSIYSMNHIRIAVNEEFAADDRILRDGDVIAVIPPVSGG